VEHEVESNVVISNTINGTRPAFQAAVLENSQASSLVLCPIAPHPQIKSANLRIQREPLGLRLVGQDLQQPVVTSPQRVLHELESLAFGGHNVLENQLLPVENKLRYFGYLT